MVDVFEDINKKKLLKVEEEWQNMEKKFEKEKGEIAGNKNTVAELLYPMWQLSQSMLLNMKDGRTDLKKPLSTTYDPWGAYTILKEIMGETQTVILANTFFIEKKLPFSVDNIKTDIEKNLIDTVRAVATEEAYDKLIDMVFNCSQITTLRTEREQLAFNKTIKTQSVESCEKYIAKYIGFNSKHRELVVMRRDSLAFVQMDATVAACRHYLITYPQSRFKEEVTSRLHRYEFNQLEHTSKACQEYLDKYPNSAFIRQVSELKTQYAYEEMKAKATIEAYNSFINEYKQSDYASAHSMIDDAQQLLNQALIRKYISPNSTLEDLKDLLILNGGQFANLESIRQYYYNLLYLPSSAFMNSCDGLIGRVVTIHNQHGEDIQEVLEFNQQGLLNHHSHSKTGLLDSFEYSFDNTHGYQLIGKTDEKHNRATTYTTKYNDSGALEEISGNDGTKIHYSYNGYMLSKVTYMCGNSTERTDYYNNRNLVEKSVRSGNTIVYEYNAYGDVTCMKKMKGNTALLTSTYEYEYQDEQPWKSMSQYNDGNYLLTKTRNYDMPRKTEQKKNLSGAKEKSSDIFRKTVSTDSKATDVVEIMPCFPGGDAALMKFLNDNMVYPKVAEENGIQGRVICSFVVERDGSITEIEVIKSVDPSLDREAVRILSSMPRWQPGSQDGELVRVKYTTPITFRLR